MRVPSDRPWFQFWPEGVPKHVDFPEMPVFDLLRNTAKKYPDKTAFEYQERNLSYQELDILSDKFATALEALGTKKDSRVMIFLPNLLEHVIGYYGILKAGAIVSSVSPLTKEMALEHQIGSLEAETLIVDKERLPIVLKVKEKTGLKNIILTGEEENQEAQLFNTLQDSHSPNPPTIDVNPREQVAAVQYTGGTTGMPKGATMTHYNLVSNAMANALWFKWTKDEIVLDVLPLYHTWGACCAMHSPIYVGAHTILFERPPASPSTEPGKSRTAPDMQLWLETIEKKKVTVWYGAATMFIVLVSFPDLAKYDLSSLRYVKIGAMPIPEETKRRWEKITGVPMNLGYGLTEASPETHSSPPERVKIGTIGIPIINTDAKIMDDETGTKEVPIGEIGELVIKGPQVMKGYWRAEEQTKETLRDGWLYTGDIAKMDEEGYFYIVDRKKETIKYKGYSVYPAEAENVLYTHPAVKECVVIGVKDPDIVVGEKPKAFVVLKEGVEATEELKAELIKFCRERIAPYKRIREVEYIDEIPKSRVGKVLRRVLREREAHK
jgi:long-chain acyl-CoA synthetase